MVCKVRKYDLTKELIDKLKNNVFGPNHPPILTYQGATSNQVLKERIRAYETLFGGCGVVIESEKFFCATSHEFLTHSILKLNQITTKYLSLQAPGSNGRIYQQVLTNYKGMEATFYLFPSQLLEEL